MIPDKIKNSLFCALAKDEHIFEQPITMSCGHCACKKCISKQNQPIICQICNEENHINNLNQLKECIPLIDTIDAYLQDLYETIYNKFKLAIPHLKDQLNTLQDRIDIQFEYIKDEIDVRVESIKARLDKLNENIKIELDKEKSNMKTLIPNCDFQKYDDSLTEMKRQIEINNSLNKENFYEYQDKVKELNKLLEDINNFDYKVKFNESDQCIDESLIGYINYSSKQLINRIKYTKAQVLDIECSPYSFCVLIDEYLLVADYQNSRLLVYDKNFHLNKTIVNVNGQQLTPVSIETNNEDRIYIGNHNSGTIISLDLRFQYANTYGNFKDANNGNGANNLNYPIDMCFYDNYLYVCDFNNKRIQKLSRNLTYEGTYPLQFQPWNLKIINKVACIRGNQISTLFFYDVKTFQMKHKFDTRGGPLCTHFNYFYHFNMYSKRIYCFDQSGSYVNECVISDNCINNLTFYAHTPFILFNNKILISAQKKFILI